MKKLFLNFVLYSLPGLVLAAYLDSVVTNNSDFLNLFNRYGFESPFLGCLGSNPYLYHILGIHFGILIFLAVDAFSPLKNIKKWIWPALFIAAGVVVLVIKDMYLPITIISFGPAVAFTELKLDLVKVKGAVPHRQIEPD